MFTIDLPWPETSLMLSAPFAGWHPVLRFGLVAALILIPIILLLTLYRYELRLVPRLTALALLGLRLTAFAVVLLLVCGQPIYARDRKHTLPGRVIVVVDRSASMDVPDPQRAPAEKLRLARALGLTKQIEGKLLDQWIADHEKKQAPRWLLPDEERSDRAELISRRQKSHDDLVKQIDGLTRAQVAERILEKDGLDVMGKLTGKHHVELYVIDREVSELKPEEIATAFGDRKKVESASFTDLRGPLLRALERSGPGQGKILGVIVLTDGQHNTGRPPADKARELGERGIPIFPVALGEKQSPPDVALVSIRGPNHTVFKGVDAAVEARFKIAGMAAQEFLVEVHREGKERKLLASKTIAHDGKDRLYTESFPIRLEDVGTQTITATIKPMQKDVGAKETIADNNAQSTTVAVADDRARVLLVDGEARWEYHYLATALQRDRLVDLKAVVFDQPRLDERLTEKELEKLGLPSRKWPDGPDALAGYSCVILGDVAVEKLTAGERQRLERYVADAGGTLIVVAGKRSMPLGFPEKGTDGELDPLYRLLPIEMPRVLAPEDGVKLTLTRAGRDTKFMELESDREENETLWAGFPRPWGWAIGGRTKPGATALAHVPSADEASLPADQRERRGAVVARHNFGFGRVLFVGLDSTWRWRYKVGDLYHHRFWGQVIRWAAADRPLVVGNEFVRLGTPQPVYRSGEPIELVARINDKAGPLRADLLAGARVLLLAEKPDAKEKEKPTALTQMARRAAQPRVLEGQLRDLAPGRYAVELAIPDLIDKLKDTDGKPLRATFTVLPPESKETVDLERNDALLEDLATRSGGQVFTPANVTELAERLKQQGIPHVEHHEQRLWQWWPLLVLVVLLLTLEWIGRKLSGLP